VHGHDFSCIASIPTPPGSSPLYVSGSEEKILRVLEGPTAFEDTLAAARGQQQAAGSSAAVRKGRALGAAVAALGLSNKAVYEGEEGGGAEEGVSGGWRKPCCGANEADAVAWSVLQLCDVGHLRGSCLGACALVNVVMWGACGVPALEHWSMLCCSRQSSGRSLS
jgi:hypothetical protein